MGLVVFAAPPGKVFLYDLVLFDPATKVVLLLGFGLVMVALSHGHIRASQRDGSGGEGEPVGPMSLVGRDQPDLQRQVRGVGEAHAPALGPCGGHGLVTDLRFRLGDHLALLQSLGT